MHSGAFLGVHEETSDIKITDVKTVYHGNEAISFWTPGLRLLHYPK